MTEHEEYQPGPAVPVEAEPAEGEKWTLVFVRELAHSPESVWSALTDPAELAAWAPFDADRNLGATGNATLTMAGGGDRMEARVRVARAPQLLEYTWGPDLLRWELEPIARGTRLTLRHTVEDRSWVPKVTAGWHICLDVAERALNGAPIGRIVAAAALQYGWERLNDEYSRQLGIENTGVPEM
jgi:uncharacterized protein YndB with AHSA1/START domain